jgi:hypothetical protein
MLESDNAWHSCRRKVRYRTRNEARRGASRAAAVARQRRLHVYKCDLCCGYHLTSGARR